MANSSQALKRVRQNNKRRLHNSSMRSRMRTARKKFIAAIEAKNKEQATIEFGNTVKILDQYASKGIIHKNTVARYKSRSVAMLKSIASGKEKK